MAGNPEKGKFLGDMVYGATDGTVTTFAIVAAAVGASLPPAVVVILGLANLAADGFSMGASNFLGRRSEGVLVSLRDISRRETRTIFLPFQHGLATFIAFTVAGFIPLVPYLIQIGQNGNQFAVSAVLAGATFFGVGTARALVT